MSRRRPLVQWRRRNLDGLQVAFALMRSLRHACMWSSIATNPIANPEAKDGEELGSTTTYHGDEHPYLRGLKVRIVAVMKRAAAPMITLTATVPIWSRGRDSSRLVA